MKKVVLIKPNGNYLYSSTLKDLKAYEPPIWHLILTNYFKSEKIIDAEVNDYTNEEILQEIDDYKADKAIILATGNHPSAFIQQLDAAYKLKTYLINNNFKNVEVLDKLPVSPIKWGKPRWDLIDLNKYKAHNWHAFSANNIRQPYATAYSSISCPFRCSFCTIHHFYGNTFEQRLIEDVIADFKDLAMMKIKNIKIMDELFIFNKNRVKLICEALKYMFFNFNIWCYARIDIIDEDLLKSLKQAGIKWLAFGIETGNDEIRRKVLKGNFTKQKIKDVIKMTKDAGINVMGNYIFGFWEDNLDTMRETLDLAIELNTEFVNFYCLVPYPNTPLYEQYKKLNIDLPKTYEEYSQLSENFKPLPTKYLSGEEVLKFRDNAFKIYFDRVRYLSLIQEKFGLESVNQIIKMLNIDIRRNYVKNQESNN